MPNNVDLASGFDIFADLFHSKSLSIQYHIDLNPDNLFRRLHALSYLVYTTLLLNRAQKNL